MNTAPPADVNPEGTPRLSLPAWFWLIAIVALLWYLMDLSAFFMRMTMSDAAVAAMSADQRHLFQSIPGWANVAFAAEVFGGFLGAISLLLRKRWALPLFCVSLLGVLTQSVHVLLLSDAPRLMGAPAIVMPLLAMFISVVLILLARSWIGRGWLR